MFRAIICSSSGGKIGHIQHLLSSPSISGRGGRAVHRLREDYLNLCNVRPPRPLIESDDTKCCAYNFTAWGWAYYSSKHVEECNIMWTKKFCALVSGKQTNINQAKLSQLNEKLQMCFGHSTTLPHFLYRTKIIRKSLNLVYNKFELSALDTKFH